MSTKMSWGLIFPLLYNCLFILGSNEKSDLLASVTNSNRAHLFGGQGSMFFLHMCVYKHSCGFVYVSSYKQ